MSTNGHVNHLSESDIDRIMTEWDEITYDIKGQLHANILNDSRDEAERELDFLLTIIIPACFQFGYGAEPPDFDDDSKKRARYRWYLWNYPADLDGLYEDFRKNEYYLWNCPKFAQIIHELASHRKKPITTRKFIEYVFSPRFKSFPQEDPIKSLKRLLIMRDGRRITLKRLLGDDELSRIEEAGLFKDAIQKVSKQKNPDSSDVQEELKAIPALTTRA